MFRFAIALLILLLPGCGLAQGSDVLPEEEKEATSEEFGRSDLPNSPGALLRLSVQEPTTRMAFRRRWSACNRGRQSEVIGDGTLSLEGCGSRMQLGLLRPTRTSASTAEQAVLIELLDLGAALQYAALERRRHSLLKEPVRRDDGRANLFGYGVPKNQKGAQTVATEAMYVALVVILRCRERSCDSAFVACASYNEQGRWPAYF